MSFVPKFINIAKSFKCGCSQFKFGTNPPVTMMAKMNKEQSEELIAFVTNTTLLASKDESKPTERNYMWGFIPFHKL